jgi:hypothetical protein
VARPAKPTGDLKTALSWCYTGLRQAERVRESCAEYRTTLVDGRESLRLLSYLWGDAHFLIIAAHHMNKALQGMPSGPALPQPLGEHVEQLRRLLEHWWEAQGDFDNGSWEALAIKHGAVYATPWSVEFDGFDLKIGVVGDSDLKIEVLGGRDGVDHIQRDEISVQEVEQVLTRVLDELLHMDTEELEQVDS